jgi:predicted permease
LLILFSVLPPAVLNFLVAERYRQEPARVAAIVMIGNLGAVVSVPLALAYALR